MKEVVILKEDLPYIEVNRDTKRNCLITNKIDIPGWRAGTSDFSVIYKEFGIAPHREITPCSEVYCSDCKFNKKHSSLAEIEEVFRKLEKEAFVESLEGLILLL